MTALGEFHYTSIPGVQRLTVLHKLASSSKLGTILADPRVHVGQGQEQGRVLSYLFMAPSWGALITTSGIIACGTAIIGIRAI